MKLGIQDLDLQGKRVLMRVDFNVPLEGAHITDDSRIRKALPSIQHVIDSAGKLVLMSHLGRPKGQPVEKFRLAPCAKRLSELLGKEVKMAPDCMGWEVEQMVAKMQPGDVVLLENLRFHPGEEANGPCFAFALTRLGDVYVNDAFGAAHRAHASTEGVTHHLRAAGGLLIQKEIKYLGGALASPNKPFVTILGGSKVSDKIPVIENLLDKVDAIIIGGGMAYTFLKVQGIAVGGSLVEQDMIDTARELLERADAAGVEILLPVDHVVADKFDPDGFDPSSTVKTCGQGIEEGWIGLDIGPETVKRFAARIAEAGTVVWNGPVGVFEQEPFRKGTLAVAHALAESSATSIVGGGDTASAVDMAGVEDKMSHVSTGGGASLEFLEGKDLPGISALADKA